VTDTGNGARPPADPDDEEAWEFYLVGSDDPVAESERAILGTVISSAEAAAEAAAILRPEHFARSAHQVIFETVLALLDHGDPVKWPVEPAAVLGELHRGGRLDRVGDDRLGTGGNYLHSLATRAGSVGYHAPRVLAAWQQRNVGIELRSCAQIAAEPGFDPGTHLELIRQRVNDATAFAGISALRPQWETVNEVLLAQETGADPGISTGYPDLDDVLGGLRPGEMTVVAAAPGTGKTTLAVNIADHVAGTLGLPVLISSLEMREEQLTLRRIAAAAGVGLHRLVRHQLDDGDWDKIRPVHTKLTGSRLYVDDTPGASLAQHRGRLLEMRRQGHPAALAVIDHIGLLAPPKAESRQQEVAELARSAKILCRELEVPLILVSPVNRGPAGRPDRKPRLSDLRESGAIEGHADNVLLLHREEGETPRIGEIDVIVAKNRMGPTTTVTLGWQGHYSRVVSLAPTWTPAPPDMAPPDPVLAHEQAAQEARDELAERRRRATQDPPRL
jgi:replicative DNA helicase